MYRFASGISNMMRVNCWREILEPADYRDMKTFDNYGSQGTPLGQYL
jgi:hypothetical protein